MAAACLAQALSAQTAPRCEPATRQVDTALATIVRAVNDGSYAAITRMMAEVVDSTRLPRAARPVVQGSLGRWHWMSRRVAIVATCATGRAGGSAVISNALTGEQDRLDVQLDSVSGRVARLQVVPGHRVIVAAGDTASDDARVAAIRRLVRQLADSDVFSGEVLFARDGRTLYHEAVGLADRAARRAAVVGDRYSIASVGKLVTGTAVMQLVERGVLALDDTLGRFLGDSARPRGAGGVPLRTILSHTDGLVRGADAPSFAPGTRFSYVNYGYALLGDVIERVTGRPFADHFAAAIFAPAGMRHTERLVTAAPRPDLPTAYAFVFDSAGPLLRANPMAQTQPATGAGWLFSTAEDLFRFAESLRLGKLVTLATLDSMRTPKRDLGATDYGYGVDRYRGHNIWGHSGLIPGANADLELYGDSGYTLVVLSNTGANDPVRRLVAALVGERPFRVRE
ncbi:MAG: beta-lactamase family protein [Gemmatimonadetes bacterium]|nr:beta-lactamase family protein [Gemmatimonadota bacterium]